MNLIVELSFKRLAYKQNSHSISIFLKDQETIFFHGQFYFMQHQIRHIQKIKQQLNYFYNQKFNWNLFNRFLFNRLLNDTSAMRMLNYKGNYFFILKHISQALKKTQIIKLLASFEFLQMDESVKQPFKYKKVGNHHTIRIRRQNKSNNMSPQPRGISEDSVGKKQKLQFDQTIQNPLKNIPRTIVMQGSNLVEGCFSYVDEGFEKWKIGKPIGKGKSSVHKAMNVKTGMIAAVKQIVLINEQREKDELNQINVLRKIHHQNIVGYIEHYRIKNEIWIFMQYVPSSLKKFYQLYGPPPAQIFLKFAKQMVTAVAHLQKQNVLHKDIKCENMLLDNDGVIKICDFGSSHNFNNTLSMIKYQNSEAMKSFKGSFLWSAPEYLKGSPCSASDIWSLGCAFVELASGKLPWYHKKFDNQLQVAKFIVQQGQIPKIEEDWDERIKQLLKCCLKRQPSERITAAELQKRKDIWE